MNERIIEARQMQADIAVLQQKLSNFTTPKMFDTTLLPKLYNNIMQCQIEPKEIKHCFVFIAVYLYSPSAVLGQYSIKAGLCLEIGKTIGRCRQEVSETFYEALMRYNRVNAFKAMVNDAFNEMIKM